MSPIVIYLETYHLYFCLEIDFLRDKHEGLNDVEPKMWLEYAVIRKVRRVSITFYPQS